MFQRKEPLPIRERVCICILSKEVDNLVHRNCPLKEAYLTEEGEIPEVQNMVPVDSS